MIESALRVNSGAVRQPITSILEKGQAKKREVQNLYSYPLNIALSNGGSLEVLKMLAEAAPSVMLPEEDGADGSRSLDIAMNSKYDWQVINMLLHTNVESSQVSDRRGSYLLHIAANLGLSLDIVRTLCRLFPRLCK